MSVSVSRLHDFLLSHTKMWCSWTDVGLSGVRKGDFAFLFLSYSMIILLIVMLIPLLCMAKKRKLPSLHITINPSAGLVYTSHEREGQYGFTHPEGHPEG